MLRVLQSRNLPSVCQQIMNRACETLQSGAHYFEQRSLDTCKREAFVRRICALYPEVEVEEQLDTAHCRIRLNEADPLMRQRVGKRTLVFGYLQKGVMTTRNVRVPIPTIDIFPSMGTALTDAVTAISLEPLGFGILQR